MNTLSLLDDAVKQSFILVKFSWGTDYKAFTNAPIDQIEVSGDYTATPEMEVDIPPNSGGLSNEAAKITLPIEATGFIDEVSLGEPFGWTTVVVTELVSSPSGAIRHQQSLYEGVMTRVRRNPGGKTGVVEIDAKEPKDLLEKRPAGMICSDQCAYHFGRAGCGVDVAALEETGVITDITNEVVTLNHLSVKTRNWFRDGLMIYNGAALLIRNWVDTKPTKFTLNVTPPSSWIDQTVTIRPGCNRTEVDCRIKFDNQENFNGSGIAIPAYNPLIRSF